MPDDNVKALETRDTREKALAADRRRILALPLEKALDAVLEHPYPVTLVQSMAEEDLYLLVHTIGPDDALPVLGLASNAQWEYLLDMEIWLRDRIDPHAMTQWYDRLLRADPDRFTHWITGEQRGPLDYYLFRNVEVHIREYEQDPSEIGDGFSTEDDVHYIRLRPYPAVDEQAHPLQETRDLFVNDLLRRIAVYDFPAYQGLLIESSAVIAAEGEEELLRLRNVRLAERGFLPFEEAVGVYQALTLEDLLARRRKSSWSGGPTVESYPLPSAPAALPETADLFTRILVGIQDEAVLHRLQSEFAGLCNQVIAADQRQIRDKAGLAQVVAKVGGYINIGLAHAEAAADKEPYRGANLIQTCLLADIFRVGYGRALELKWRADRWRPASWFHRLGLPLSFWGEAWLGVLGGLLIKRPLFYDNYASGALYREFATLDDIGHTERILAEIIAVDDLLALLAAQTPREKSTTFLTCHNLLLTLWANHHLGMEQDPQAPVPLTVDQLRSFLQALWEPDTAPRRIKDSLREAFLAWLAQRSSLTTYAIAERMRPTLEGLFAQIENELGAVAPQQIDPRYVQLFLLRAGDSA
jgi:hypothetical protein